MKLQQLCEYGGYIKHSKPSTKQLKLPNSAYGNQPITTFNTADQDSAMGYWKDILKYFNKKTKLNEMPWVMVGDNEVVDVQLEKTTSREDALSRIDDIIQQLPVEKREKFIRNIFTVFPHVMQRYGIKKGDIDV
jgi:hypothetical protein